MIAKGYFGSFTIFPYSWPRLAWWSFSRIVCLPTGVSMVRPSSAFDTLSDSVLFAFLMASARNCMPRYPWIGHDDGYSSFVYFERRWIQSLCEAGESSQ